MKEKKKSTLSKLMVFAGNHKYYVYASCILATISAFMALVPFYDIWRIIKEVLEVRPHFNEAVHIKNYGGHAVLFALLSMIFYIVALMCSHKAAFRVQATMRTKMMEHIMKLPLGYVESQGQQHTSEPIFRWIWDTKGTTHEQKTDRHCRHGPWHVSLGCGRLRFARGAAPAFSPDGVADTVRVFKGAFAADIFCAFGVGQRAPGFGDPVGHRSAGFGFGQKGRGGLHAQGVGPCRELRRRSFSLFAGAVRAFPVPQHRAYGRVVDVRRLVRHAGVLRALRERRGGQACAADPDTVPVRAAASDDGVSAEQRKYSMASGTYSMPMTWRACPDTKLAMVPVPV